MRDLSSRMHPTLTIGEFVEDLEQAAAMVPSKDREIYYDFCRVRPATLGGPACMDFFGEFRANWQHLCIGYSGQDSECKVKNVTVSMVLVQARVVADGKVLLAFKSPGEHVKTTPDTPLWVANDYEHWQTTVLGVIAEPHGRAPNEYTPVVIHTGHTGSI